MYSNDQLNSIFDRTDGQCHICRDKLKWKNYGIIGELGSWEVDHSNPKANGGTDRMNNLYAACIPCNRSKGSKSTRSQRRKYGYTAAPESRDSRVQRWTTYMVVGFFSLLIIGHISNANKANQKAR